MFITKKHMSRRTILRGAGATLALPLLEAMIPASTALAQTAATPKPRFVGCFVPHGAAPGYWVPEHRRQTGRGASLQLETAGTVRESDRDHERPAFPLGRTASGRDGRRPLGGRGVSVRQQTQEDRRRGRVRGHHHRSDHRAKDRRGEPDAVHAAGGRGPGREFEQLRRGLQLHLHQHHLLVVADRSAADGAESAGGVRAHVRRRQHRRAARRAAQAGPQHSGLADGQRLPPSQPKSAPATATGWTSTPRTSARSSAGWHIAMKASTVAPTDMSVPVGVPQTFDEHIKLQFDLMALAFQADITRVGTLLFARDLTGRTYPECEAPTLGFPWRVASRRRSQEYRRCCRRSTSITSRCWRISSPSWPRPRTATARCWIIRWCSMAATWGTPISTSTTMCRTCWSAD